MKNKVFTVITIIIILIIFVLSTTPVHAMVDGIDSYNYDSYVKPNNDAYGYNIGECEREYLPGEEYFYNEYYDHWNVDTVYDSSIVTSKKLAIAFAQVNYPNCKVKIITMNKKNWKKILKRKNKNIVYVEKCVTKSSGKNYGYTIKGHNYVAYNCKVKKNTKVTSYFVYNPYTNYSDDIVAVVDNKMVRSDFSY